MEDTIQPEQQGGPSDEVFRRTSIAVASGTEPARVWRACLECRKRKSKCDGKDRCKSCTAKNRECVYFESNDNASGSRQTAAVFELRCQQMDALCQKMESLMGQFNQGLQTLNSATERVESQSHSFQAIGAPPLVPQTQYQFDDHFMDGFTFPSDFEADGSGVSPNANSAAKATVDIDEEDDEEESEEGEEGDMNVPENLGKSVVDHYMTTDSYGKLRFVGGTSNMVIIEALKSLSPPSAIANSPEDTRPTTNNANTLEFPLFTRGLTWPRLPGLAKPEQLAYPPRYVSDLLINLYFDQLHYTMPVIYKPHFMQRYSVLLASRNSGNIDAAFLSVFFAVCACASGLLPREPGQASIFTGLRYYESAISLHYASTGEGSIEQVQCLALLSMCTAGWNTLAQSWKFAGQAVRAAQDLGLHRSPVRGTGEVLKEELCRRIWWSVYGLDRVLSNCLGRPMGVEDGDCDCEMPRDLEDNDLETYCKAPHLATVHSPSPEKTSRLTGFIVFSKLCQISGRITRSMTTLMLQQKNKNYRKAKKLRKLVKELEIELAEWLEKVPDVIKFSVNDVDHASPHLTMCVIVYSIHAGCIINLHRPLIPDGYSDPNSVATNPSYLQCVSAARSCIQIAEFIQTHVPQSHHLAICTHYLALSGVFLIRNLSPTNTEMEADVDMSIQCLANLESVWMGAKRSRVMLEELFKVSKRLRNQKRSYAELEPMGPSDLGIDSDIFAQFF